MNELILAKNIIKSLKDEKNMVLVRDNLISAIDRKDMNSLEIFRNIYNQYALCTWEKEMTRITDFKQGNPFKFIVHNLTKDDFDDEFITPIVSASLITDKTMGVYSYYNTSRMGFILYPAQIIAADEKDCYTNNEDVNNPFQITPSIKLPNEIEKQCIEICTKINGEILSDENKIIYSEIVLSGFYPIAIYAITNGEKEIGYNYRRTINLNKKYDFPFIDIDKSIYRENNNLEPITIKEQKELCRDILYLLDINDNKLIDKYYYDIYKEFINLKKKQIYNSDTFLDIVERKIYTKRI